MNTTANTPAAYLLCTFRVRSADHEYTVYELRQSSKSISIEKYQREVLEFCLHSRQLSLDDMDERMQAIREKGFSEWAYDDRLYCDPHVQELRQDEYEILSRYL